MDGKSLFMQWFRKEVRSISIGLLCHRPRHDEVLMAWKESQWVSLCKSCDSALSLENQHCRQMFQKCIIQKNAKKVFINTFRLLLIQMVLTGDKVLGDDEGWFFSFTEMLQGTCACCWSVKPLYTRGSVSWSIIFVKTGQARCPRWWRLDR